MNVNVDRFALKPGIRASQASIHAINGEIRLAHRKFRKYHARLIKKYMEANGGRKGWKDYRDAHATYQSLKAEIEGLYQAREKQRLPSTYYAAHDYLKGKTFNQSCHWFGSAYEEVANWIPEGDEETVLCLKMWAKDGNKKRKDIETFGVEDQRVQEIQEQITKLRRGCSTLTREVQDKNAWLKESRRRYDQAQTRVDTAASLRENKMAEIRVKEQELEAARQALVTKKGLIEEVA